MDLLESDKTDEPSRVQPIRHRPFLRPFLTSTPLDFLRERDFLSQEIFPELDRLCQQRACHFMPTDLRYDENERNAQNGNLLKLHLDMISRTSPFFICLMGERYGYHRDKDAPLLKTKTSLDDPDLTFIDKNLLVAASGAYKWILEDVQQYSSLTELEIIQACFFSDTDYSFLYFRQQDHVDGLFLDDEPEVRAGKLTLFESESEHAGMKARDLKQRIVNRGLSVKYFQSLHQLGQMVLKDWAAVIDLLCPPLIDVGHHFSSEFYTECVHSEAVAAYRKDFVSSYDLENLMADLTHFTASSVCDVTEELDQSFAAGLSYTTRMRRKSRRVVGSMISILALSGRRGCGKTSVIARWMEQAHLEHEDVTIVSHHVGGSRLSQDVSAILRKLVNSLWLKHAIELTPGDLSVLDLAGCEYRGLVETFMAVASLAPTVIVIDGVDQLAASRDFSLPQIKKLLWLPEKIPPNVKFILSTSSSDATYVTLRNRPDVRLLDCPNVSDVTLRERILNDNLGDYKIVLPSHLRQQILTSKRATNPLFLKMVAMEMSSRSVFTHAEEMVETFTDFATVREFWMDVLRRWVLELSWVQDGTRAEDVIHAQGEFEFLGWVADALRLVAVSRQGLGPAHLFVCLQRLGYHGNGQVSMADLALLWEAGHKAFMLNLGPVIGFQHPQLKEVVDYALLGTVVGDSCEPSGWNTEKNKYHEAVLELVYSAEHGWERSQELLHQAEVLNDTDVIYDELTDYKIFLLMSASPAHPARLQYLHQLWDRLTSAGYDVITVYRDVINCCAEGTPVTRRSKRLPDALLTDDTTFLTEVDRPAPGGDQLEPASLSLLMYHVARFLWKRRHVTDARDVLAEAHDLLSKNYPLPVQAHFRHCQILEDLGRIHSNDVTMTTDVAMDAVSLATESFGWFQRALSVVDGLLELTGGANKLFLELKGRVLDELGSLYIQSEDVSLARELLHQSESCFDLSGCTLQKSSVLLNLAKMSALLMNFKEAQYYCSQCARLRQQWLGRQHPSVADVLLLMAGLADNKDNVNGYDRERAELLYRQAVQIREDSLYPTHPYTAEAVLGLGCLLKESGSLSCKLEARTLLQRALDIHITRYGYGHPACARISKALSDLSVTLKLGLYDYGPAKPTDKRHSEFPYSALSWREHELNGLDKKYRQRASSAKYHQLESKVRKHDEGSESVMSKPEIKIEDVPMSDDSIKNARTMRQIKSASTAERLSRQQEREYAYFKRVSVNVKMAYPSEDLVVDSAFMSIPKSPSYQEIVELENEYYPRRMLSDGKRSPADVSPRDDVIEETEVLSGRAKKSETPMYLDSYALPHKRQTYEQQFPRMKARPVSAPVQLEKKFTLLRMREPSPPRPVSRTSTRTPSASGTRSPSRTPRIPSATSLHSHRTKCPYVGPHSITKGNTSSLIQGPHSDIQSLLGPRRPESGIGIHHKAAWYHVPGRYPTPRTPVPSSRSQLAQRAKSVSSTSCTQVALRARDSPTVTFQEGSTIRG